MVYHRRSGGQSQFSTMLDLEPTPGRIRDALAYARQHLKEHLSVEPLAEVANISPRQFARQFTTETGDAPPALSSACASQGRSASTWSACGEPACASMGSHPRLCAAVAAVCVASAGRGKHVVYLVGEVLSTSLPPITRPNRDKGEVHPLTASSFAQYPRNHVPFFKVSV